ncbi:MAG: hypothetical protein P4L95_12880 [Rouxiella aceris]|uniref:hypothetical protein n=1 Tax=Rouxiella aceris TaxID=2703884 RepID=UPI00283BC5D4|nr:hypothetical protein [Rouxiella aceris]MDR3432776.1 hypothetical protein [Rouxiella aceris]
MLFQYTNLWQVFLRPQLLQLYLGKTLVYETAWENRSDLAAALETLFDKLPRRGPFVDRVEFILDHAYLDYLIVPWQQGVATPADRDQFALALHQQQHGRLTGDLLVAFFDSEYQKPGFAALLEKSLFAVMRMAARRRRLRFCGCRTLFAALCQALTPQLPANALYACIDTRQSSFALRYQQQWHSVFTLHLPVADTEKHLETANCLAGLPPVDRYVVYSSKGLQSARHLPITAMAVENP